MLDRWPLIGRDQEMQEVTGLMANPDYQGVAISGKAGVGKSRLAHEVVHAAEDAGWSVRRVAATATSRSIPLGAFAHWADGDEGAPVALARTVIAGLAAGTEHGRLLVFVDDAHLLDDLSALVVHQLVHTQAASVIVTVRAGDAAPAAITALWKDRRLRMYELKPLSHRNIDALLTEVFAAPTDRNCVDRLWRLTDGNVLFLRQLVEQEFGAGRLLVDRGRVRWREMAGIPASLAEMVDAQIGAVRELVRDVVDLVAVAEPIHRNCLRALADQFAIEEAEQRQLIRTADDLVYVGHPMYAEVRIGRCGPSRLRRLRGQVAMTMTDDDGAANAVRRGLLWLASDLSPDPDVLLSAATAASSLLDFEVAERLFRAAAEAGVGVQARVHLAYNLFMMQKAELSTEVIETVDAAEVPDSAFVNDVMLRAANLLWPLRSPGESWRVIDEALEHATGARRQQLMVFRANQLSLAARPADVLDTLADVDYRDLDTMGQTIALCAECLAYAELGRTGEAVAKAADCRRVVDLQEQGRFLGLPLVEFHTFALAAAGYIRDGVAVAEAHLHALRDEPASARAVAAEIVGMTALAAGDLRTAIRHLPAHLDAEGADVAVTNSFHVANSFHRFHLMRAQALARSGHVDAAERALRTAREHRHPSYVYVESLDLLTEAWLAAGRQRLTEARQKAREAAEFARSHNQLAREVWYLQTAVQFDDTQAGARLVELANCVEGPRVAAAGRYAVALSADDAPMLDQVSTEFEAMGDVLAAADAAGQAATSHRRAGLVGSAITSASRCRRLAAECGATSPAISAASLAAPFTNREREIAVLVAQGLSNREIAEEMSLSVRTIEGHIYRASSKAGVAGRAELATVIRSVAS